MKSDTRSELLPCPHCGGTDIRFDFHGGAGRPPFHAGEDVWSMCCYGCGATFPNRYRKELLVEAWNRRTPPKVGSGELDAAGLAKLIESARGKAAVFADINPTFAEIERDLRAASTLLGPKSFINDTVVFAAPVDHPEVVGVAVKRDWVDCPICHEPDMRMETDAEGHSLIYCVNHSCPSNDRTALQPSDSPALEAGVAEARGQIMSDEQIRHWASVCNDDLPKRTLQHYLKLRAALKVQK